MPIAPSMVPLKKAAERFAATDTQGGRIRGSKTGRMTMRIPYKAYQAAIVATGGVRKDGTTCWDDPTYRKDMRRMHPEIDRCPGEITFPPGITRFGKASEHIVYPRTRALESASTTIPHSPSPILQEAS